MHDLNTLLPTAGHQGHGPQRPDYCYFPPHRHVQVRAFLEKCSVHDQDILLPAAGHQGVDAQAPDGCNYLSHEYVQVRAFFRRMVNAR